MSEAELILEKVEENYLEADSIIDRGSLYPKANEFSDENTSTERMGHALGALAKDESPTKFTTWHNGLGLQLIILTKQTMRIYVGC
jgi:hypothetical protein